MKSEKRHPEITIGQAREHLAESSRALADLTASMVYDEPELFGVLIELALTGERLYAQRASRVVEICTSRFPVAIRVYGMQILFNLGKDIPEIGDELARILEDQLPDETPGYRSRANKILGSRRRL